jgi:XTP/dITP diphosphohydrolase
MDRLRSPGGCAWDAEQTHASLTRYLLEETYEVLEAIETHDEHLLREELGDLLLQVLFHARIASERPDGFDIEDVAGDLVDKLVRRHPHVFAEGSLRPDNGRASTAASASDLNETWEQQKIAEKERTSATDGVPIAQPALSLAAKLIARTNRAGLDVETSINAAVLSPAAQQERHLDQGGRAVGGATNRDAEFGARLLGVVREAVAAGVDPEGALRRTTLAYRDAIRAAESTAE